MMQLGVGMENTQGMLLAGAVIAQHQMEPILPIGQFTHNGGNGIMGRIGMGVNIAGGIGILPPGGEHLHGDIGKFLAAFRGKAQASHGPIDQAGIGRACDFAAHSRFIHGEDIIAALIMIVGEDRAAHDGKISIGAQEIMGETIHKIKEAIKGFAGKMHGFMLAGKHDAMLIVLFLNICLNPCRIE